MAILEVLPSPKSPIQGFFSGKIVRFIFFSSAAIPAMAILEVLPSLISPIQGFFFSQNSEIFFLALQLPP
jgi:hypothetical protein